MLKKTFISSLLIAILVILSCGLAQATVTIATFADPSEDSDNPLFTIDFSNMKLNGGWADDKTGLILEIPYSGYTIDIGNAFENAWFDMTEVTITSTVMIPDFGTFGQTGSGEINFYEDGNSTDPLVVIDFESGLVSQYSFGADEIFTAENVTITGSKITGTLSEEKFTFGFANLAYLTGSTDWNDGFTATASFTSSAVPEPATIGLLGLGALSLLRRKRSV